MDFRTREEK